jgi:CBS domain containing-hemolysin-like protein
MTEFVDSLSLWSHWLVAMAVLVSLSAFFSASETALFFLSHDELRKFRVGTARERAAARLLREPDRLLTAVLFWNLLVNLLYFAVTVVVGHRLAAAGQGAAAGVFGLASLFLLILFGEVLSKSMAVVFRKFLARTVSWPLSLAVRALDPILPRLAHVTRVARRTFWPHVQREPHLEAGDLERLVEVAGQSAEVVEHERQVLHNILDLSEVTVEEVMRPRGTYLTATPPVRLSDLNGEVPPGEYIALVESGSEDVVAAVSVTTLVAFPRRKLEDVVDEVPPVPWCASVAYTLELMRQRWTAVASVVNEYGETIGIVLEEDVLDTLLAARPSRVRRLLQREPVLEVAPHRYHVEGLTTLRYLSARLGVDYEPSPDGLLTVAGLVYEQLESLPAVGDECRWHGWNVRVIEVGPRGRLRVMVSPPVEPEP